MEAIAAIWGDAERAIFTVYYVAHVLFFISCVMVSLGYLHLGQQMLNATKCADIPLRCYRFQRSNEDKITQLEYTEFIIDLFLLKAIPEI